MKIHKSNEDSDKSEFEEDGCDLDLHAGLSALSRGQQMDNTLLAWSSRSANDGVYQLMPQ